MFTLFRVCAFLLNIELVKANTLHLGWLGVQSLAALPRQKVYDQQVYMSVLLMYIVCYLEMSLLKCTGSFLAKK